MPWRRLKSALEGGIRQRITWLGLFFSVAVVLVGLAAFASANNLLFLLLAAMLSTLMISGFISRLSLSGLEINLAVPQHISAGRKFTARLSVRNTKGWVPSFSIHLAGTSETGFTSELYFPMVPGGGTIEEVVEVSFARRGRHTRGSFQVSTRFPFGFTERRAPVNLAGEVVVYPCLDAQPPFEELMAEISGEISAQYRGRGHDFHRIRPYEAFESARHVDWKASAHTGELQVREFAREQEHLIELFLDLDLPAAAREGFERAVECCAHIAWRIAQRGARLRLRTQEFDACLPEECDIYAILKYLALVLPVRGKALPLPDDDNSFQVVFTAAPARAMEAGWMGARMVDLGAFTPEQPNKDQPDEAGSRAGEKLDHRRRKDRGRSAGGDRRPGKPPA